jgi:hypothetical protein
MPADFYIDRDQRMVFSKGLGVCGYADMAGHMEGLLQEPDFDPEFNQLLDAREITKLELTHAEIRELAKRTIFSPLSRRAIVVASDVHFGLGRMFGTYREIKGETGIQVFREMAQALKWLALPAPGDNRLYPRLSAVFQFEGCGEDGADQATTASVSA